MYALRSVRTIQCHNPAPVKWSRYGEMSTTAGQLAFLVPVIVPVNRETQQLRTLQGSC